MHQPRVAPNVFMEQFWHISEIFIAYTKLTHKQAATNYRLNGVKKPQKTYVSRGWQVETLLPLSAIAESSYGTTLHECQVPCRALASPYMITMSCSKVGLAD